VQVTSCWARTAHDRFGLTSFAILRSGAETSKSPATRRTNLLFATQVPLKLWKLGVYAGVE